MSWGITTAMVMYSIVQTVRGIVNMVRLANAAKQKVSAAVQHSLASAAVQSPGVIPSSLLEAAKEWGSTVSRTAYQNMIGHFYKHVIGEGHSYLGNTVIEYTKNALDFFSAEQGAMALTSSGRYAIRGIFNGYKVGGFFSVTGVIFSFF